MELIEILLKKIPELIAMGPMGMVLSGVLAVLSIAFLIYKAKNTAKKEMGKNQNQAGTIASSEAQQNSQDLNNNRSTADDFFSRDNR